MAKPIVVTATRFVDLVLLCDWRGDVSKFPAETARVLLDTVVAAGFEAKQVKPGKLRGNYLEQDGSPNGETYAINDHCPFKVVHENGADHYGATAWLDCAVWSIMDSRPRSCETLVVRMVEEIKKSNTLPPIQLTAEGDFLEEYPPRSHGFGSSVDKHTRDEDALDSCVGVHQDCRGWIDRVSAAKFRDALVCRSCHLRVSISKDLKTYGDLRRAIPQDVAVAV